MLFSTSCSTKNRCKTIACNFFQFGALFWRKFTPLLQRSLIIIIEIIFRYRKSTIAFRERPIKQFWLLKSCITLALVSKNFTLFRGMYCSWFVLKIWANKECGIFKKLFLSVSSNAARYGLYKLMSLCKQNCCLIAFFGCVGLTLKFPSMKCFCYSNVRVPQSLNILHFI